MSLVASIYCIVFLFFINNGYCSSLEETLGENEETNHVHRLSFGSRKLLSGKGIGEMCGVHTDCEGWGLGKTDNACCRGICQKKILDYAGNGYCPHECTGRLFASPGTCPLRKLGETCRKMRDCVDGCCIGTTCRSGIRDRDEKCWCPNECQGKWPWNTGSNICDPDIKCNIWQWLLEDAHAVAVPPVYEFNNFNPDQGEVIKKNSQYYKIYTNSNYMMYIYIIIALLVVLNISCIARYCYVNQNNSKIRYKTVSIDSSTDVDI